MFGPGGRMGHLLKELDMLQSPDAPAWFTADRFADADRDQNGSLDAEEWSSFSDNGQARVIEQIINIDPSADANKDGDLSDQELQALADTHDKRTRAQMLKRHPDADTDGDGTLSDSEVEAVKSVHLSAILGRHPDADLNADGVLTGDEFHVFTMTRHGPGAGPPGEFPPSPEWILERHPEADTDGDGELSDEEIEAFRESNPHGPRGGGPRKQGRID